MHSDSKKRKFLVECESLEPSVEKPWPRFRDFQVRLDKNAFKSDKRILVARCTMTICLASPMGHRPGSGGVADMVPFIELTKMSFTTLDSIP